MQGLPALYKYRSSPLRVCVFAPSRDEPTESRKDNKLVQHSRQGDTAYYTRLTLCIVR